MLDAVKRDGRALHWAAPELHVDREIVLEAVKQNGLALMLVDTKDMLEPSFKACEDKEIMLEAPETSPFPLLASR